MEKKIIDLKYGKGSISVEIPEKNIMDIIYPNDLPGADNEGDEIRFALENPISSPRLKDLAKGKKNIVILASDITRPAPTYKMLPPLINELTLAGVLLDEITIIFGLGYHRKHTKDEVKKLIGEEYFGKINYLDHDINNCINIGRTSRGTPVEIFKPVLESDFVIATGNLELHYFAGYSGGNKALMPGVCSKATIQANHSMMTKQGASTGIVVGNPLREDIEEVGGMGKVAFILNVVLNSKKEIVKAVAGDPLAAHRAGIETIDNMYKIRIPSEPDIIVASCGGFPKDINLYQAQKGLDNARSVVKLGGRLILIAESSEGFGEHTFEEWMTTAKTYNEPIKWIQEDFVLGGHKAAAICMAIDKSPTYLISNYDKESTEKIFFKYAENAQLAIDEAIQELGLDAKILIMPYANSTLPFIDEY